jgi:GntP family gluconate:H+ symporter
MATTDTSGVLFLLVGYLIAAILKTAQGSTTSALIIASSILMPLASSAGFQSPIHLSILLVALGGGAMSVSHGNDSYFWVVTQFGGFESRDSLRTFTWITLLQGLTAFLTSILLFVIL